MVVEWDLLGFYGISPLVMTVSLRVLETIASKIREAIENGGSLHNSVSHYQKVHPIKSH